MPMCVAARRQRRSLKPSLKNTRKSESGLAALNARFGVGLIVKLSALVLPSSKVRTGCTQRPIKGSAIVGHGIEYRPRLARFVLDGDSIVVTMPGTSYSVTYRKLLDSPLLVASDMRDDPDSPINKFTFRARAWIAANDKARELRWIV